MVVSTKSIRVNTIVIRSIFKSMNFSTLPYDIHIQPFPLRYPPQDIPLPLFPLGDDSSSDDDDPNDRPVPCGYPHTNEKVEECPKHENEKDIKKSVQFSEIIVDSIYFVPSLPIPIWKRCIDCCKFHRF